MQGAFCQAYISSLPKKAYNDPNHAFPLHSDMSVTTIHSNTTLASPIAADANPAQSTIPSSTKEVVIVNPATQDNVSTLSSTSKNDLIKMFLDLNCKTRYLSGSTGFAPTREVLLHSGPQASVTSIDSNGSPGPTESPYAVAIGK